MTSMIQSKIKFSKITKRVPFVYTLKAETRDQRGEKETASNEISRTKEHPASFVRGGEDSRRFGRKTVRDVHHALIGVISRDARGTRSSDPPAAGWLTTRTNVPGGMNPGLYVSEQKVPRLHHAVTTNSR